MDVFKEKNPDYFRQLQTRRRADGKVLRDTLLREYGLTIAAYEEILRAQNRRCAICNASEGWKANGGKLVVDHCHNSGKVRGLLCPSCNRGLGQFEDDPSRLFNAIQYLQRAERRAERRTKAGGK